LSASACAIEMDQIDSECEYVTPKKSLKKNDTTKPKNKRLQKYKRQWEIEHGDWLTNDRQNEFNGKCKLCGITFTIASAGIGQVSRKIFFCLCFCGKVKGLFFFRLNNTSKQNNTNQN